MKFVHLIVRNERGEVIYDDKSPLISSVESIRRALFDRGTIELIKYSEDEIVFKGVMYVASLIGVPRFDDLEFTFTRRGTGVGEFESLFSGVQGMYKRVRDEGRHDVDPEVLKALDRLSIL